MADILYISENTTSNAAETYMNIRRVMDGNKYTERWKSGFWAARRPGGLHSLSLLKFISLVRKLSVVGEFDV